jgi:beta-lactamase superfamily II metal-dependent hydrolase
MAWSLEIHHIDVTGTGDATLILAKQTDGNGAMVNFRSCLIDGGRAKAVATYLDYLQRQLNGTQLNVVVCTHYDGDHFSGLTSLLINSNNRVCDTSRIYDQGWPPGGLEAAYVNYVKAIYGYNNDGRTVLVVARNRVTASVCSDLQPGGGVAGPNLGYELQHLNGPVPQAGIGLMPYWLLQQTPLNPPRQNNPPLAVKEVLWDGVQMPNGAPTISCIAVNKYIVGNGVPNPVSTGQKTDPKNEKSLAFVVKFNKFRYYIGGDIEEDQENYIQSYLNEENDIAHRVLAMKCSHHGAQTATSRSFVDRLRPEAAFISCGTANTYKANPHPTTETINVLDGFPRVPVYTDPYAPELLSGLHGTTPPPPPCRPITSYLTGYQVVGPPSQSRGGYNSYTAGDPTTNPVRRGDIVVKVSEAQSQSEVAGQVAISVSTAGCSAAQAFQAKQDNLTLAASLIQQGVITSGATSVAVAVAAFLAIQEQTEDLARISDGFTSVLTAIGNLANNSDDPNSYYNQISDTVINALLDLGLEDNIKEAAGAAAKAAASQYLQANANASSTDLARAVTNAVTNKLGFNKPFNGAAAAAGAAAGAALNGKSSFAAESATYIAVTEAGGIQADADTAADRARLACEGAALPGLFDVSFYDKNMRHPGIRTITHS